MFVLEGQQIYRYLKLSEIRGRLIIKRTAVIKCWKRSIFRHIKRKRLELEKNKISKKQYYQSVGYWFWHRTEQLKYYKDLNRFLDEVLHFDKKMI